MSSKTDFNISALKVDTIIEVSQDGTTWKKSRFAFTEGGRVFTFTNNRNSRTFTGMSSWNYARTIN